MMQDRSLKIKVIEYFVRRGWYPHMEVNVLSQTQISSAPKLVTDIDALGLAPDVTGRFQTILGDCKTLKGQSGISRVLWMKGLIEYFGAQKGLILLIKNIEKDHQLTANALDVQLFSESDFDFYSKATADYLSTLNSSLIDGLHWDSFMEIDKRFPRLRSLVEYARTQFWNDRISNNQVRSGLSTLRELKGELDPANKLHLSIVLHHYSLLAISLNQIIADLFTRFSLKTKEDLSSDLKVIIYGGIANYQYLNDLRRRFSGNTAIDKELSLPEWDLFVELIRLAFESPMSFNVLALYLKELSFCFLSPEPNKYTFAKEISNKDKYTTTFAVKLSEYLNKACGLPPEFHEIYSKIFVFGVI
ncbi:hypothetical protein I6I98_13030 [Sphingobacterium multivorum]|uniref:Uncharacterized protein n=1 Tax=Sphingobacterium multivorum TaxID=28454 RepID=A0ABX7CVM5_SPHMU|nr:hypothetical protein [Sphingobacterium multivorum]QQT56126.1 hypothetical protein I6I98_13030 [Sphingobacterium multivorum]